MPVTLWVSLPWVFQRLFGADCNTSGRRDGVGIVFGTVFLHDVGIAVGDMPVTLWVSLPWVFQHLFGADCNTLGCRDRVGIVFGTVFLHDVGIVVGDMLVTLWVSLPSGCFRRRATW